MSPGITWLPAWTLVGALGLRLLGLIAPRPRLHPVLRRMHRTEEVSGMDRLVPPARRWGLLPDDADLHLLGETAGGHLQRLLLAAGLGAAVPGVVLGPVLARVGWAVPLGVVLLGPLPALLLQRRRVAERVTRVRADLRHQLSGYLDVVTMLLAGNSGYEGALRDAGRAGDGRLFLTITRRAEEATASGQSLVEALQAVAEELGLVELEQVAATITLSATEGAPVARSLTARCATLRATLAAEQETEARLRTSRLTAPLVGIALVFMSLIVYPALGR